MVFNATFNNISAISWRSVLLVEETGVPGKTHRPVASHWQTLSHNVSLIDTMFNINLMKIRFYCIFFSIFFFGDKLTSNNIPFGVMTCKCSFVFYRPIICKAVNSCIGKSVVNGMLITDWSVEIWTLTCLHYGM
jgi:hypothetical protein